MNRLVTKDTERVIYLNGQLMLSSALPCALKQGLHKTSAFLLPFLSLQSVFCPVGSLQFPPSSPFSSAGGVRILLGLVYPEPRPLGYRPPQSRHNKECSDSWLCFAPVPCPKWHYPCLADELIGSEKWILVLMASVPCRGAKIPHAWQPKTHNIKQKQYCSQFSKEFKNGPLPKILKKKKMAKCRRVRRTRLESMLSRL